jgi:hypothetical protein
MVVGTRVPVRVGRCQAHEAQPDKGCVFLCGLEGQYGGVQMMIGQSCPCASVFIERGNDN